MWEETERNRDRGGELEGKKVVVEAVGTRGDRR